MRTRRFLILLIAFSIFISVFSSFCSAEEPSDSTTITCEDDFIRFVESIVPVSMRDRVSISVYFTSTDELYTYNADHWYGTASIYKLPLVMMAAKMEYDGCSEELEKMMKGDLDNAKHLILRNSNNTYAIKLYNCFKKSEYIDGTIALSGLEFSDSDKEIIYGTKWNMVGKFNVPLVMGILKELYTNQEQYPKVIDYMCEASPTAYLRSVLEDSYTIAQKYGSVDEWNHIAGIIYTEQPVLVVIMTEKIGLPTANRMMGNFAAELVSRIPAAEVD